MTGKRVIRIMVAALGLTIGVVVLVGLAIIAHGEWRLRQAQNLPPPTFSDGTVAAAPVLILLHGAGLNGRMWDAVRRRLDPADRVIAPDLPGHGKRRSEVFTLEAATATVVAAARSVAPAPVVLVGDSLGGYVAMASAPLLPPRQLRGLVVGGCTADLGHAALLRYLRDVVLVGISSTFIDQDKFVGKALKVLGVSDPDARAIMADGVSIRAVPADVRALLYVDFRGRLAAIDRPVLIVNGARDANAMSGEAGFLAAAKHATSYHFENTEHGVSMRRSAEFAGVINDFAARAFAAPEPPEL